MRQSSTMQIVQDGVAISSDNNNDSSASSLTFPDVCVLPAGRWLVACRAAPQKTDLKGQHILLSYSDDAGATWSTPASPFVPPEVEGRPGLFRTASMTSLGEDKVLAALAWVDYSNPDLPFFNEETQGLLDSRIFTALSHDGGATWSTPALMDTSPFQVPTPVTGPILVLPDGEWVCQFELNKPYDELSEWRHSSIVMFSRDKGASWPEYSTVSNDPDNRYFYWDQRVNVAPDGKLLDLFWTYDNVEARYLEVHARASNDNGRSWSPLWGTGVPGQPARPVFLSDGSIVMVVIDREEQPTIKAYRSVDGGHAWGEATMLYHSNSTSQTEGKSSMQDAWAEMFKFSVGFPSTALLPDGDVLIVFYAGDHTDQTDVRWVRLRI